MLRCLLAFSTCLSFALGQGGDNLVPTPTTFLFLQDDSIEVDGPGATVLADSTSTALITSGGVYSLTGTLLDGQILVNTLDNAAVTLVLNGVDITSSSSAPIFIMDADQATLYLAQGTENIITDSDSYANIDDDGEPNAAIFSKDDLVIDGSGMLTVKANYNHGIASNDHIIVKGNPTIMIEAANDGLKGKDSIQIMGSESTITVTAGGDGMQSSNDDLDKGYVWIEGGVLNLTSASDGIDAASNVTIFGGDINIQSGGGSDEAIVDDTSAKGIKADFDIVIHNGTIEVDAADDAIHGDQHVVIHGGSIVLATGDDGIRGNSSVTIHNGDINIVKSVEGIEGPVVTINGGSIRVTATDDGINAAAGGVNAAPGGPGGGPGGPGGGPGGLVDGNSTMDSRPPRRNRFCVDGNGTIVRIPRPPQPATNVSAEFLISINGGYIYVDSSTSGDGIDSNARINITDGTLIVNGPTVDNNGALDSDGDFTLEGGYLLAVGSSNMAQTPASATSTQMSIRYLFETPHPAGTVIHVESEQSGTELFTFTPVKEFQAFVFSSSDLVMGETYKIFVGGFINGSVVDGLCEGACKGTYTSGEHVGNLTATSIVTNESNGFNNRPIPDDVVAEDLPSCSTTNAATEGGNTGALGTSPTLSPTLDQTSVKQDTTVTVDSGLSSGTLGPALLFTSLTVPSVLLLVMNP